MLGASYPGADSSGPGISNSRLGVCIEKDPHLSSPHWYTFYFPFRAASNGTRIIIVSIPSAT